MCGGAAQKEKRELSVACVSRNRNCPDNADWKNRNLLWIFEIERERTFALLRENEIEAGAVISTP